MNYHRELARTLQEGNHAQKTDRGTTLYSPTLHAGAAWIAAWHLSGLARNILKQKHSRCITLSHSIFVHGVYMKHSKLFPCTGPLHGPFKNATMSLAFGFIGFSLSFFEIRVAIRSEGKGKALGSTLGYPLFASICYFSLKEEYHRCAICHDIYEN